MSESEPNSAHVKMVWILQTKKEWKKKIEFVIGPKILMCQKVGLNLQTSKWY